MDQEHAGTDAPNPDLLATDGSRRPRFSPRSLLVGAMVICILLAILVPSLRQLRRLDQQRQCQNSLKQIALALHNYRDVHTTLPWACTSEGGTPIHSWRVAIVPYLEQQPFYSRYDYREPWNGPNNGLLGDDIPDTWYQDVAYRATTAAHVMPMRMAP